MQFEIITNFEMRRTEEELPYVFSQECPWVEHLTSLPKRGVGVILSGVSAFNYKKAPTSYLTLDMQK